jgi:exopolysaccharide/PEP-CTERM locus tyrosine autokinase
MGLIEQAAKRLEELRRAGIEVEADPEKPGALHAVNPRATAERATAEPAPRIVSRAPRLELNLAALAAKGFVTPEQPRSQIADEFRMIKRPLIANVGGKGASPVRHGNLIMVTSSVPGEGKTFTAINLAMSIAMEVDRTVLLVDADVARPSLPRTLGIPEAPGMLDILDGNVADTGQVIHPTNVEKLTFLSSGRTHPRASEVLASEAMTALLDELANRYPDRIVVFDSPPLLVTTEAGVLANRMGQIVFVVSAESTLKSDVTRALATIETCPVKMTVLNKARSPRQGAYGYGYGYGY